MRKRLLLRKSFKSSAPAYGELEVQQAIERIGRTLAAELAGVKPELAVSFEVSFSVHEYPAPETAKLRTPTETATLPRPAAQARKKKL